MKRPKLDEYNNDLLKQVVHLIELEKYCDYLEEQNKALSIGGVSNNEACEVVVCPNCKDTLVKQVASTNKNCVSCGTTVKAN